MGKEIATPYLLFLGDAREPAAAKTAAGIADWYPERVLGQMRLPSCQVDLGLRDVTPEQAARLGARTMVIGIASTGGVIADCWLPAIETALQSGLDVASGLHARLADVPRIRSMAERCGRTLFDVRHPDRSFSVGTGLKRSGLRVLTVGSDCVVGKKYSALALTRELRARGVRADFRATGQTGILMSGGGVAVDAVVADFISGAAEWLSPDNEPDHWDVIEGQGSLFHPAYAGVALGLIHGSQPDALVICHEPTRKTMVGFTYPVPGLEECIERSVEAARLTNSDCRAVGISINSSRMDEEAAAAAIRDISKRTGLPCADPVRHGLDPIVDEMVAAFGTQVRSSAV